MSTSLEILENVWNANPGGLAFAQYANALLAAGRAKDARSILAKGLENWPRHFAGRMLMGQVCQQISDMDGARAAFQEAVALDSASPGALRGLATVLGRQQYHRQAVELWVRLSLLDPEDEDAASTARRLLGELETTSSLADLGIAVRDEEDARSREALTEGASSATGNTMTLWGSTRESPLANWAEPEAPQAAQGFDLGDLAFPVPPSNMVPQTSWSAGNGMDSTIGQVPVQPTSLPAAPEAAPPSAPKMASSDDSALATIEMTAFPARTIPPPPLETPRVGPHPGNESGTKLLNVVGGSEASDATQAMSRAQMSRVTGDDIGARLDDLFGEAEEPAAALPPLDIPAIPAAPVPAAARPLLDESSVPTRVTGEDVEDRLSEIFGSPSDAAVDVLPPPPAPVAPPAPAPSATASQPRAAVTGDDIEARLDDLFGASSVDLPIHEMPASDTPVEPARPSSAGPVSGHDIEARIESLFGAEPAPGAALEGEETSAMERSEVLGDNSEIDATATIESMRSFQAAADLPLATIDPSDVDSGGSTLDLPVLGGVSAMPSAADGPRIAGSKDLDSQLDELFASSEFLVEQTPPPSPQRVAGGAPVTGDDIGDRLDDLFGADSDFPAGVPTVTLAEEYLRQGYRDQALAVYRQLQSRDPGNTEYARRIAQIEGAAG